MKPTDACRQVAPAAGQPTETIAEIPDHRREYAQATSLFRRSNYIVRLMLPTKRKARFLGPYTRIHDATWYYSSFCLLVKVSWPL